MSKYFTLNFIIIIILIYGKNVYSMTVAGEVLFVKGEVSILDLGKTTANKLVKGDKILEESSIFTKTRSFAKIKLLDGSVISIGPKSKMEIRKSNADGENLINL